MHKGVSLPGIGRFGKNRSTLAELLLLGILSIKIQCVTKNIGFHSVIYYMKYVISADIVDLS